MDPIEKRPFYHPELDIVRFGAFLLVFISHVFSIPQNSFRRFGHPLDDIVGGLFSGGIYGVDLFFALSSYLITELLLRELRERRTLHVKAFYLRRILRIWPLYFFFLLCVRPLYQAAFPSGEHFSRFDLAAFLLFSGNWVRTLGIAAPLWSISIEEQFYLVWPLTMKRWSRYLPQIATALIAIASLMRLWSILAHSDSLFFSSVWTNTFARLDPIAAGALLAYSLQGKAPVLRLSTRALILFAGFALIITAGREGNTGGWLALITYPSVAIAAVLIIVSVLAPVGTWKPGRGAQVLIYLGKISYGLYVFHILAFRLAAGIPFHQTGKLSKIAISTFLISVLFATLSYQLIEMPFLRLKKRFTYVDSRPVSADSRKSRQTVV